MSKAHFLSTFYVTDPFSVEVPCLKIHFLSKFYVKDPVFFFVIKALKNLDLNLEKKKLTFFFI